VKSLLVLVLFAVSLPVLGQENESVDPVDLLVQLLNDGATSLDPKEMLAWVDLPRSVKKGDSLTLRISVENARNSDDFNLESVDLDGSFLRAFRIESIAPTPVETDDSFNSLTLEYQIKIAAGEIVEFVLEMTAVETGVYIGEVSIWDEEDFLSRYIQCKVID